MSKVISFINVSIFTLIVSFCFAQDGAWPGSNLGTLSCPSTTTITGNTTGAVEDCNLTSSAGDHIYQFTISSTVDVTIDLCSSSYDTQIHLFDLASGNCNGTPINSNDDDCGLQSSITETCLAAGDYVIIIEGYSGNEGAYSMDIITSNCSSCPTVGAGADAPWPGLNLGNIACGGSTSVSGNTTGMNQDCGVSGSTDLIYQFSLTATSDITLDVCGASWDTEIHLFDLSYGSCNAGGEIESDDDGCGSFGGPSEIIANCLPAGDYVVVVSGYGAGDEGVFTLDINTTCNTTCGIGADTPWPGLDLGSISCGSSTSVSGNTTGMIQDCSVSNSSDLIYEFSLTSAYTDLTLDVCGASWDTELHLFELSNGSCNAGGEIETDDDGCGSFGGPSEISASCLPAGDYVVIVTGNSSSDQGAFTLNIDAVCGLSCTPPPNDDCSGAYPVNVNTDGTCNNGGASGTVENATPSSQDASSCFGAEDDDVWFSFVAPSSGEVNLEIDNVSGSTWDLAHSVWSGTCPTLSLVAGSCSDPNSSNVSGLTPGDTYYVRVYSYTSTSGQTTTFDLCIQEVSPCGNLPNNDFCSDPAVLTQGGTDWSSSTSSTYSADSPANTGSIFCGSIENNSWYMFTALSTTETFDFSTVNNCRTGSGIQAEVYEVTTDANGCCTGLTSMSNCWNPSTAASGTVTATGLTVGNDYYLMVDGYAGDNCDFTVTGWDAVGILPVELLSFDGSNEKNKNVLVWKTASEKNNDYFLIKHSTDGINWSTIEKIKGAGSVSDEQTYSMIHRDYKKVINYYSLQQVDYDGTVDDHGVVAIDNTAHKQLLKRINLMGQEVNENYRGVVLLYFNDGSIEKTIQ